MAFARLFGKNKKEDKEISPGEHQEVEGDEGKEEEGGIQCYGFFLRIYCAGVKAGWAPSFSISKVRSSSSYAIVTLIYSSVSRLLTCHTCYQEDHQV